MPMIRRLRRDEAKVAESRAITLILGEKMIRCTYVRITRLYDYTSLKVTTYDADGLRRLCYLIGIEI